MITHVAIKFNGKLWSLPAPNRHHHIISMIHEETGLSVNNDEQGFLDDAGNFLNRKQALVHALMNDQVKDPNDIKAGRLFSEDVW